VHFLKVSDDGRSIDLRRVKEEAEAGKRMSSFRATAT
jgi:chemotaxis protein histidine kinase CheA